MVANYGFDVRHGLSTIKDAALNQIAGYTLDDAGKLTRRTLANGLETAYAYDDANLVTGITLRQTATPANVIQSFGYGYDGVGNRTWVQYQNGTGDVYRYDETYQVTGVKYGVSNPTAGYDLATGATRTVTYAYDEVGNRTSVTDSAARGAGATRTYTSNNLNQYTNVGSTSLTYSPRGDLASDGTWTYGYDYEGHLISATKPGTNVTYKYDTNGRRIEKDLNGVAAARYVYDEDNLIEERDGAGTTVTAAYVYAGGVDHPVAVVKASGTYYFAQDALGNVTALTDASGTLVEQYSYDVYGQPTIKDGSGVLKTSALTPFLFTGREYDSETGLYHYRSWAYSPTLGRFLQPDRIDFSGGDVNIYRYVSNNPINFSDPLGLITVGFYGAGGNTVGNAVLRDYVGDQNVYDRTQLGQQRALDAIKKAKKDGDPCVNIIGYSWGTRAARDLANKLKEMGIDVDQLTLIDPISQLAQPGHISIPSNVHSSDNYYQTSGGPFRGGASPNSSTDPAAPYRNHDLLGPTVNHNTIVGEILK